MLKCKIRHNSDKGKKTYRQLLRSDKHLDDLQKDGTLREDLNKEERNYQQFLFHQVGKVYDDVVAKHPEGHEPDYQKIEAFRKLHIGNSGSSKQYVLQFRKILQILAIAVPPSKKFYWVSDIEHFALYYNRQFTGIMIYVSSFTGLFTVTLENYGELISVPTLRQAQTICHAIAWVFRNSLPIQRNHNKSNIMYQPDKHINKIKIIMEHQYIYNGKDTAAFIMRLEVTLDY